MVKVPGFEYYYITEDGRVFSTYKNTYRKLKLKSNGYIAVDLCCHNKHSMHYVHRLVASAFIPNPDNKKFVNHIDGDKSNNCVSNLEWVSGSENMVHAINTGLLRISSVFHDYTLREDAFKDFLSGCLKSELSEKYGISYKRILYHIRKHAVDTNRLSMYKSKLLEISSNTVSKVPVLCYTLDMLYLCEYPSLADAARELNKSSAGPIHNALNKPNKSAYGFRWKTKQ